MSVDHATLFQYSKIILDKFKKAALIDPNNYAAINGMVADATFITAQLAHSISVGDCDLNPLSMALEMLRQDPGLYPAACERMKARMDAVKNSESYVANVPLNKHIEMAVDTASYFLLPGNFNQAIDAAANYHKYAVNTHSFGVPHEPPLFNNLLPEFSNPGQIRSFSLEEIRQLNGTNRFIYVVDEDNNLTITIRHYLTIRANNELDVSLIYHSDVAKNKRVFLAGELEFVRKPGAPEAVMTKANNASGHYRPKGIDQQHIFETAFRNRGFKEASKEIFTEFNLFPINESERINEDLRAQPLPHFVDENNSNNDNDNDNDFIDDTAIRTETLERMINNNEGDNTNHRDDDIIIEDASVCSSEDYPESSDDEENNIEQSDNNNDNIYEITYSVVFTTDMVPENLTVFRGTEVPPEQSFNEATRARGTNFNISEHVQPTAAGRAANPSGFIPTTTDPGAAEFFAQRRTGGKNSTAYVCEIVAPRNAVDVADFLKEELRSGRMSQADFDLYRGECEVAIPNEIKPEMIRRVWPVELKPGQNGTFEYIPIQDAQPIDNPRFREPPQQRLFTAAKWAGHTLTGIAVATDIAFLVREYSKGNQTGNYQEFFHATCEVLSGWSGAVLLGKVGASLGSVAGPWGSLFLGGAFAIAGYYGASNLGGMAARWFSNAVTLAHEINHVESLRTFQPDNSVSFEPVDINNQVRTNSFQTYDSVLNLQGQLNNISSNPNSSNNNANSNNNVVEPPITFTIPPNNPPPTPGESIRPPQANVYREFVNNATNSANMVSQANVLQGLRLDVISNHHTPPTPPVTWVTEQSLYSNQNTFNIFRQFMNVDQKIINIANQEPRANIINNYITNYLNRNSFATALNSYGNFVYDYLPLSQVTQSLYYSFKDAANSVSPNLSYAYQEFLRMAGSAGESISRYDYFDLIRSHNLLKYCRISPFASARDVRDFLSDLGYHPGIIGGVGVDSGVIKNLLNDPAVFTANDFNFIFPFEITAARQARLNQIQYELNQAFYKYKTLPFVSIHFIDSGALEILMDPIFKDGVVYEVFRNLDILLKQLANGYGLSFEFIDTWNHNFDETYLMQNAYSFEEYFKKHNISEPYISLRKRMALAGIEDRFSSGKYGSTDIMSSFNIKAFIRKVEADDNNLFFHTDFRIESNFEPMPDYQAKMDAEQKRTGSYPENYLKTLQCHAEHAAYLRRVMPQLPICQEYFKELGFIVSMCNFNFTMEKIGKRPLLTLPPSSAKLVIPQVIPPTPVAFFDHHNLKLNYKEIFAAINKHEEFKAKFNNHFFNAITDRPQNNDTDIGFLMLLISKLLAAKLPASVVNSPDFSLDTEVIQKVLKSVTAQYHQLCDAFVQHIRQKVDAEYIEVNGSAINTEHSLSEAIISLHNTYKYFITELTQACKNLPNLKRDKSKYPKLSAFLADSLETILRLNINVFVSKMKQQPDVDGNLLAQLEAELNAYTSSQAQPNGSNENILIHFLEYYEAVLNKLLEHCENRLKNLDSIQHSFKDFNKRSDEIFELTAITFEYHHLHSRCGFVYGESTSEKNTTTFKVWGGADIIIKQVNATQMASTLIATLAANPCTDANLHNFTYSGQRYSTSKIAVDQIENVQDEFLSAEQQEIISFVNTVDQSGIFPDGLTADKTILPLNDTGTHLGHLAATLLPDNFLEILHTINPQCLNTPDKWGNFPVHYACKLGNRERVAYLLDKFPHQLENKNKQGHSLLWIPAEIGDHEMVKLLLERNANPNDCAFNQQTPIFAAIRNNQSKAAHLLAEHPSTNLNVKLFSQETPLHKAIEYQMPSLAVKMIKNGADASIARKSDGFTAHHLAARLKMQGVLNVLHGKPPTKLDNGKTFLHLRAEANDVMFISYLDRNTENERCLAGNTPLMTAIRAGNYKSARVLAGKCLADDFAENPEQSLVEFAYQHGMPQISDRLFKRISPKSKNFKKIEKAFFYLILTNGDFARFENMLERNPGLINFKKDGKNIAELTALNGHFQLYYAFKRRAHRLRRDKEFLANSPKAIKAAAIHAGEIVLYKDKQGFEPTKCTTRGWRYWRPHKTSPLIINGDLSFLRHQVKKGMDVTMDNVVQAIDYHQMGILAYIMPIRAKKMHPSEFAKLLNRAVAANSIEAFDCISNYVLDWTDGFYSPSFLEIAIWQKNASMLKKLCKRLPDAYPYKKTVSLRQREISKECITVLKRFKVEISPDSLCEQQNFEDARYKELKTNFTKLIDEKDYSSLVQKLHKDFSYDYFLNYSVESFPLLVKILHQLANAYQHQDRATATIIEDFLKKENFLKNTFLERFLVNVTAECSLAPLIEQYPDNVSARLITLFLTTIRYSWQVKTLHCLIDNGLKESNLLRIALRMGKTKTFLILADLYEKYTNQFSRKTTKLHEAIITGNALLVVSILSDGQDKDIRNNHRQTPLMIATAHGHQEIVQILLKHGANPNIVDYIGFTSLHYAIALNQLAIAELLLKVTKNHHQASFLNGLTPLHLAAEQGMLTLVQRFCYAHAAYLNLDHQGQNALHKAAVKGQVKIIEYLLTQGFDVNTPESPRLNKYKARSQNRTALQLAIQHEHPGTIAVLNKNKAWPDKKDANKQCASEYAVMSNNLGILHSIEHARFVESSSNIHKLMAAAKSDNLIVASEILVNRGYINATNKFGLTALHYAIIHHSHQVAEHLIKQPTCGLNVASISGNTPLHQAVISENTRILVKLLEFGAHKELRNHQQDTPLLSACRRGFTLGVTILLAHGANAKTRDGLRQTAAELARQENFENIALLIENYDKNLSEASRPDANHSLLAVLPVNPDKVHELINHQPIITHSRNYYRMNAASAKFTTKKTFTIEKLLKAADFDALCYGVKAWIAHNRESSLEIFGQFIKKLLESQVLDANKKIILLKIALKFAGVLTNEINALELETLVEQSEIICNKYKDYLFFVATNHWLNDNHTSQVISTLNHDLLIFNNKHLGSGKQYFLSIYSSSLAAHKKRGSPRNYEETALPYFKNFCMKSETVKYPFDSGNLSYLKTYYFDKLLAYAKRLEPSTDLKPLLIAKKNSYGTPWLIDVECLALLFEAYSRVYFYPNETQAIAIVTIIHSVNFQSPGIVAEMATGEGKTGFFGLVAGYYALKKQFVNVTVAADYFAENDLLANKKFFELIGVSFDWLGDNKKNSNFGANILYGTSASFKFASMRAQLYNSKEYFYIDTSGNKKLRKPNVILADELDQSFIEEANSPANIAMSSPYNYSWVYPLIVEFYEAHKSQDIVKFRSYLKTRSPDNLTMIMEFSDRKLTNWLGSAKHVFENCKEKADYVVLDGKIIIVELSTGRFKKSSRWHKGQHEILEAWHQLKIKNESLTLASMPNSTFYSDCKIIGLTGTIGGKTIRDELKTLYNLPTFDIPTHKPCLRKELPAIVIENETALWESCLASIIRLQEKGQPHLMLFNTIDKIQRFSDFLKSKGIIHQVINELQIPKESILVANAGQPGCLTLGTNIVGRGTDFKPTAKSLENGGFHVTTTYQDRSKRTFRQAIGRAGRQGQEGSCQRIVDMSDVPLEHLIYTLCEAFLFKENREACKAGQHLKNWQNTDPALVVSALDYAYELQEEALSARRVKTVHIQKKCYTYLQRFFDYLAEINKLFDTTMMYKALNEWLENPIDINHCFEFSTGLLEQAKSLLLTEKKLTVDEWKTIIKPFKKQLLENIRLEWAKFYSDALDIDNEEEFELAYQKAITKPNSLLSNAEATIMNYLLQLIAQASVNVECDDTIVTRYQTKQLNKQA